MEQQQQAKKELFKEKVTAGSRTYFFDVKEALNGSKYLTVSEAKKVGDKNEYNRIMIFENQIEPFTEAFRKVYNFLVEAEKAGA
ncbi:MAG: DUF3276 family protein [Bacteroidota bacterium]|nr:DUF3276 family protein [Bacteroidota bacterium]MDP4231224.1 DUF3276 family protein [Bacteroidota bacterium]MDP4236997.1 DUF3276 family protein [Bacteroidota bacterium]